MNYDKPHLNLKSNKKTPYIAPSHGGGPKAPVRNREEHVAYLRAQLSQLRTIEDNETLLVTLKGKSNDRLQSNPIAGKLTGSELIIKKQDDSQDIAVARLTKKGLERISTKLTEYETITIISNDPNKPSKAKNEDFINSIETIDNSIVNDVYLGNTQYIPTLNTEEKWWEIWITGGELSKSEAISSRRDFREACELSEIEVDIRNYVSLLDSQAFIVKSNINKLKLLIRYCNVLTSIQSPSVASIHVCSVNGHDIGNVQELISLIEPAEANAPRVTVIDTGVNDAHPLIDKALASDSLHTVDSSSASTADYHTRGHGTSVVSSAGFGNIADLISSQAPIKLEHFVESVRVKLDTNGEAPELWGKTTIEAVEKAEKGKEEIRRIFNISIGCSNGYHDGGVTSWSEAIDRLAYNEGIGRIITIAAGNIAIESIKAYTYPNENLSTEIDDPGQALNSICVGAYTSMNNWIPEISGYASFIPPNQGHTYIARPGGLSPYSRTGRAKSAIKPEVVCEGGNVVADAMGDNAFYEGAGISSLTANHDFLNDGAYKHFYATSMAAPFAARMLAIIWARNPNYNPATIRGLLIHSAEWTQEMMRQFPTVKERVRACGYGVPNLDAACRSASSLVTLIAEDSLPLKKRRDANEPNAPSRDMVYYKLPWPEEQLMLMGEKEVELRVTLSYFTEPNSRISAKEYQGASLAWELQGILESDDDFLKRINKRHREKGEKGFRNSIDWKIGNTLRSRGTVQSDRWIGTAAELSSCKHVAVYPKKLGWWESNRTRIGAELGYSIIISIKSLDENIDIYASVESILTASISPNAGVINIDAISTEMQ